jgi:hypothetical protein
MNNIVWSPLCRITSEDCASEVAPACVAQQAVENCSGFVNFVLPGLSSSQPPYTITVRTLNGKKASYSLLINQGGTPGGLFGGPLGTTSSVGGDGN